MKAAHPDIIVVSPNGEYLMLVEVKLGDLPGLHQSAAKQLKYLPPECRHDFGLTRYRASALMTFGFNKRAIQAAVNVVAVPERRVA